MSHAIIVTSRSLDTLDDITQEARKVGLAAWLCHTGNRDARKKGLEILVSSTVIKNIFTVFVVCPDRLTTDRFIKSVELHEGVEWVTISYGIGEDGNPVLTCISRAKQ
jgi:hypothetical protein